MSHFSDYMDGVPVKISEKYKRPPRIELPYSVTASPSRAQNVVDNAKYCSTFETNILSKLRELRSAKETKKNERRHRLQLLQEAKQKKLDIIAAAEAEEKLKQLSVSEVSYPSTEEISALSPDEKTDKNCDTTPTQEETSDPVETINQDTYPSTSNSDPANILQPIQVQSNYQQNNLLDDPDPLWELKMNTKITKIPQYNNMDNITFKDFENDTSSPFDNVELKTINDMELLAQVLQGQSSVSSCLPHAYVSNPNYTTSNCASQGHIDSSTYMPTTYMDQPVQVPSNYNSPQHYPVTNGYYVPTDNTCDNIPIDNMNMYIPNYQYYVPAQPYTVDPYYNQSPQVPLSVDSSYIPQPYYFSCPQSHLQYPPETLPTDNNSTTSQNTVKSRSRSVPDIVKEFNDELVSAKLRANERSQNVSPAPKPIPRSSSSSERKQEKRSKRKSEQLPNPFDKLPSKLQAMCSQIHGMGFPLDRVARVCTLVGENDKKIIESLLIMGELMDLGFSEGRVLAALAKHEFNRDKALDELVS